jgi:hypothetical protein
MIFFRTRTWTDDGVLGLVSNANGSRLSTSIQAGKPAFSLRQSTMLPPNVFPLADPVC